MCSNVEEAAGAELRRSEVAHVRIDRVEVRMAVVIAEQLDPAMRAGVELVEHEDPIEWVESGEREVGVVTPDHRTGCVRRIGALCTITLT